MADMMQEEEAKEEEVKQAAWESFWGELAELAEYSDYEVEGRGEHILVLSSGGDETESILPAVVKGAMEMAVATQEALAARRFALGAGRYVVEAAGGGFRVVDCTYQLAVDRMSLSRLFSTSAMSPYREKAQEIADGMHIREALLDFFTRGYAEGLELGAESRLSPKDQARFEWLMKHVNAPREEIDRRMQWESDADVDKRIREDGAGCPQRASG
jgi:hypothetical protein